MLLSVRPRRLSARDLFRNTNAMINDNTKNFICALFLFKLEKVGVLKYESYETMGARN